MRDLTSAAELAHLLHTNDHLVLLENTLSEQNDGWNYLFVDPVHTLQISRASEFLSLLETMQHYIRDGYFLAGYMAYECGYFLEKLGLTDYTDTHRPLAWFGVYRHPYRIDPSLCLTDWQHIDELYEPGSEIYDLHFNLDEETYRQKVERVREHIRAGDVYQINLTGRYHFRYSGSPLALYARLRQTQRTAYSAYIRTGGQDILCFSPELFFHIDGDRITARPMKGTAPRGRTPAEDEERKRWLHNDEKNRSENIMIVDLLRNDLGRFCEIGSIAVPGLLDVETYDTVLQMTSTVSGRLPGKADYTQIFPGLFPCGSVTGAPKIKAMELIQQLEETPRGIYTGAIGYIGPQSANQPHQAHFNVAIRTLVLEQGQGVMGIGSGIVYDSNAAEEAAECKIKARFLTTEPIAFDIIEAILWDGDYQHLEQHLTRMATSAHYFSYKWPESLIRAQLAEQNQKLIKGTRYKVRLQLNRRGEVFCESLPIHQPATNEAPTVILSTERTNSQDRMYYHKTTHRPLYDQAMRFAQKQGHADVLFLNERGEVTEGAISTIFIERTGKLLTPPVECGLLAGIYRQHILTERPEAQEAVLSIDDLLNAEHIYICNAIRGLREVKLTHSPSKRLSLEQP